MPAYEADLERFGGISERALFVVDKEGKIAYKDIHDISDQPDNEDLFEVLRKL
jgi:peroxiredoxin